MLSLVKGNDRIAVRPDATTQAARMATLSDFQLYSRAVRNAVDGSLLTVFDNQMTWTAETAMTGVRLMKPATTGSSLRAKGPVPDPQRIWKSLRISGRRGGNGARRLSGGFG